MKTPTHDSVCIRSGVTFELLIAKSSKQNVNWSLCYQMSFGLANSIRIHCCCSETVRRLPTKSLVFQLLSNEFVYHKHVNKSNILANHGSILQDVHSPMNYLLFDEYHLLTSCIFHSTQHTVFMMMSR
jgi:hypothetical protein